MKKSLFLAIITIIFTLGSLFPITYIFSPSKITPDLAIKEVQAKKKSKKKKAKVQQTFYWDIYDNGYGEKKIKMTAIVKNTGKVNVSLGVGAGYFYDSNNNIIAYSGTAGIYPYILKPGEEGYFSRDDLYTDLNKNDIARAEFKFTYRKTKKKPKSRLQVINTSWQKGDTPDIDEPDPDIDRYVVSGTVKNNTKKTTTSFGILILFYDSQGNLVNVGDANPAVNAIAPKSTASFSGYSDHEIGTSRITSYKVVGYIE